MDCERCFKINSTFENESILSCPDTEAKELHHLARPDLGANAKALCQSGQKRIDWLQD